MIHITLVLCLCALFLAARLIIMVPSGTIAIRKTHNHFRGLAPGIHLRWPWQNFERHEFHLYHSEAQVYCTPSEDGARIHVKVLVDWTEFERMSYQLTLNLIDPIRATIGKYSATEILFSQSICSEIASAIKSTSHETGRFFFKIDILSILQEEITFTPTVHKEDDVDAAVTTSVKHLQVPPPKKVVLRCIRGGKYGQSYQTRDRRGSTRPPYLRLQGGSDDETA